MIRIVKDSATSDPGFDQRRRSALPEAAEGRHEETTPTEQGEPDLRLVIEPDEASGDYVYKLINHATGAEVARLTRDQVSKLAEGEAYTAGTVIRTKA